MKHFVLLWDGWHELYHELIDLAINLLVHQALLLGVIIIVGVLHLFVDG
jgi:hypothetical protein